jgi:general secretion pathway protein D
MKFTPLSDSWYKVAGRARQRRRQGAARVPHRPGAGAIRAWWVILLLVLALGLASCASQTSKNTSSKQGTTGGSLWNLPHEIRERPKSEIKDQSVVQEPAKRKATGPYSLPQISTPGAPPPAATAPAGLPPGPVAGGHVLNFREAPLEEVVRVVADLLRLNLVMDPSVKGSVTLHTGGVVRSEELFTILQAILELNDATMVRDGDIYRVVPLAGAKQAPLVPERKDPAFQHKISPGGGYGLELFHLRYLPAGKAANILKPFLSSGAEVISVTPANLLVVAETGPNLAKLRRLTTMLDKPEAQRVQIKIYPVQHLDVENLAKDLKAIVEAMGIPDKPAAGVWVEMVPMVELKSLAVISSFNEAFRIVEQWLMDLDQEVAESEDTVFVYYCQNGYAQTIADVLTGVYGSTESTEGGKDKGKGAPGLGSVPTPSTNTRSTQGATTSSRYGTNSGRYGTNSSRSSSSRSSSNQSSVSLTAPQAVAVGTSAELKNGVRLVVDNANNAIVFKGARRDLHDILRTVQKLDTFPKQVLIEVMIAEVTLEKDMNLGLEWETLFNAGSGTYMESTLTPSSSLVPSSGLVYAISRTNEIRATIRALAKDGNVNIISSPILLAAENMVSTINVGEEVPIITSVTTAEDLTTDQGTKITDRSVEYRDTGIILTVIPRINDSGVVRLAVEQVVSDVSTVAFGNTDSPSFYKRTATTNVITVDGQTVVIGGLIKSTLSRTDSGVPGLKDVPLLGYMFKTDDMQNERTELVITLTPHVIHDLKNARELIDHFERQFERIYRPHEDHSWDSGFFGGTSKREEKEPEVVETGTEWD